MTDYPTNSTAKVYHDVNGVECTLRQLVKADPDWAASRIQVGEQAIAERDSLQAQLSAALDSKKECWEAYKRIEQVKIDLKMRTLNAEAQLSEARAHCERLRSVMGLDIDWPEVTKVLDETPRQSLVEIEARAIERLADEMDEVIEGKPAIGVAASSWLRFRAARLRQQGKGE
jgi:uncharacterized protein YhaN